MKKTQKKQLYEENKKRIDAVMENYLKTYMPSEYCASASEICKHDDVYEEADFTIDKKYFTKSQKCRSCGAILSQEKVYHKKIGKRA